MGWPHIACELALRWLCADSTASASAFLHGGETSSVSRRFREERRSYCWMMWYTAELGNASVHACLFQVSTLISEARINPQEASWCIRSSQRNQKAFWCAMVLQQIIEFRVSCCFSGKRFPRWGAGHCIDSPAMACQGADGDAG